MRKSTPANGLWHLKTTKFQDFFSVTAKAPLNGLVAAGYATNPLFRGVLFGWHLFGCRTPHAHLVVLGAPKAPAHTIF